MPKIYLHCGDCLELMKAIPDGSASMVICDPPYGCTNRKSEAGRWDSVIPFEPMWEQFWRVAKPNAAVVLFAQGMFTARLMMSQEKFWRYNLVWAKVRSSGFLNANRQPLRGHEDICVFYREQPTYNPQFTICEDGKRTHSRGRLDGKVTNSCYGNRHEVSTPVTNRKFPTSVLTFAKPPPSEVVHPTQKPVDLLRWLIRSYTNAGETVLDCCTGSGSTGVAAVWEGRNFIGMEKDERYFAIAQKRIEDEQAKPRQEELGI